MKPYRGRLAPSPTGYLHLGHARTFWVAWQRARAAGGKLIFRNEDLDYQRCKPEFVRAMVEDLRWLGLEWDEGPDLSPLSGKSGRPGDPNISGGPGHGEVSGPTRKANAGAFIWKRGASCAMADLSIHVPVHAKIWNVHCLRRMKNHCMEQRCMDRHCKGPV